MATTARTGAQPPPHICFTFDVKNGGYNPSIIIYEKCQNEDTNPYTVAAYRHEGTYCPHGNKLRFRVVNPEEFKPLFCFTDSEGQTVRTFQPKYASLTPAWTYTAEINLSSSSEEEPVLSHSTRAFQFYEITVERERPKTLLRFQGDDLERAAKVDAVACLFFKLQRSEHIDRLMQTVVEREAQLALSTSRRSKSRDERCVFL